MPTSPPAIGVEHRLEGPKSVTVGGRRKFVGGEHIWQTQPFAAWAYEVYLITLAGFQACQHSRAAVTLHCLPVVVVPIFQRIIRITVLSAPTDAPLGHALCHIYDSRGIRIVGKSQFGESNPAAATGATGTDSESVASRKAGMELYVELFQLLTATVAHRAHLDERVGIVGIWEVAIVQKDIVVVARGKPSINPFALQCIAV